MSHPTSPSGFEIVVAEPTRAGFWAMLCALPWGAFLISSVGHAAGLIVLATVLTGRGTSLTGERMLEARTNPISEPALESLDEMLQAEIEFSAPAGLVEAVRSGGGTIAAVAQPELLSLVSPGEGLVGTGVGLDLELVDAGDEKRTDRSLSKSVNFYGIDAEGERFVYVVDCSGSMEGTRFKRARGELRRSIESLTSSQSYFVIFFADQEYPMPGSELLTANDENRFKAFRWINKAECGGGTFPLAAVLHALELKPDAVFLLSDGQFEIETVREVRMAQSAHPIPIHTIGFASKEGEPMLRAISKVSGGTYRFVR